MVREVATRFILSLLAVGLVACSLQARDEDTAGIVDDEPTATLEQPILGGYGYVDEKGVLMINRNCSAVVVGKNKALSAAHCFPGGEGFYNIRARVRSVSGTTYCVTGRDDPQTGVCNPWDTKKVWVEIPNSYATDDGYDLAAITLDSGDWSLPARRTGQRWGISMAGNHKRAVYDVFGWGFNGYPNTAGMLRGGPIEVAGVGTHHMYSIAQGTRLCDIDSGGPWTFQYDGVRMVTGITRSGEVACWAEDECCAAKGGKQWGVRLNDKKQWLMNKAFPGACTEETTSSGLPYLWCE